jgi:flagellar biogenesis protein FliO
MKGVSQAEALVSGFHVAFAGGALFMVLALVLFVSLLRKRHVARIEAEAAAPAPAS